MHSATEVNDPELWISLLDAWTQALLACEQHEFAELTRVWSKTKRALTPWRECVVDTGASPELYDHILAMRSPAGECCLPAR